MNKFQNTMRKQLAYVDTSRLNGDWPNLNDIMFHLNFKHAICLSINDKICRDLNCISFSYLDMVKFYGNKCSSMVFFNAIKRPRTNTDITYDELIITAQRIGMSKKEIFQLI